MVATRNKVIFKKIFKKIKKKLINLVIIVIEENKHKEIRASIDQIVEQ